jgi:hypothetical protein
MLVTFPVGGLSAQRHAGHDAGLEFGDAIGREPAITAFEGSLTLSRQFHQGRSLRRFADSGRIVPAGDRIWPGSLRRCQSGPLERGLPAIRIFPQTTFACYSSPATGRRGPPSGSSAKFGMTILNALERANLTRTRCRSMKQGIFVGRNTQRRVAVETRKIGIRRCSEREHLNLGHGG